MPCRGPRSLCRPSAPAPGAPACISPETLKDHAGGFVHRRLVGVGLEIPPKRRQPLLGRPGLGRHLALQRPERGEGLGKRLLHGRLVRRQFVPAPQPLRLRVRGPALRLQVPDPVVELPDAALDLFAGLAESGHPVDFPLEILDAIVKRLVFRGDLSAKLRVFRRVGELFEDLGLLVVGSEKELRELPLRQHGRAAELPELEADRPLRGLGAFLDLRPGRPAVRAVLPGPRFALELSLVVPLREGVDLPRRLVRPAVVAGQPERDARRSRAVAHELARVVEGVVADPLRILDANPVVARRLAVQGQRDAVQDGRLARSRVAADEEQRGRAQRAALEVDVRRFDRRDVPYG